jgi:hypothetical protein
MDVTIMDLLLNLGGSMTLQKLLYKCWRVLCSIKHGIPTHDEHLNKLLT